MKSIELYRAYSALSKLMDSKNIPFRLRVDLVKLKQAVEPISEAYERTESDIIDRYGDKDELGHPKIENSIVSVSDKTQLKNALLELSALRNETIKFAVSPIEISISDCEHSDITANDIQDLLPIIRFI